MVGGYNRKVSFKKAKRKKNISDGYWRDHIHSYYDNLHQYSKNKIHCSCPMCSQKTNNKGKRRLKPGNYLPAKNWKHSDLVKISSMKQSEKEYYNNEKETKTAASEMGMA